MLGLAAQMASDSTDLFSVEDLQSLRIRRSADSNLDVFGGIKIPSLHFNRFTPKGLDEDA